MSRTRHRSSALVLLLCLALLAAACGGDDGGASADPGASASTTAPTDDGGDGDDADDEGLVRRDAGLDLPRSVTYAGVDVKVVEATWSNAQPATFGRDEPTPGDDVRLFLEVTTEFVDGFPGTDGFFPLSNFTLDTAGGESLRANGADSLAEVPVLSNATSTVVMAFEVAEDDLDGAVLTYDDGEHVSAHLHLTDDVEPSPYPIRDVVDETAAPQLKTGCDPAPADVTLAAVEWDVDGGVGVDGQKLARGVSSRALVDHRWLRVELEVTARVGQCGGTFANQETFRVVADGARIAPLNTLSLTLADGERQAMSYLFSVPVDAAEVALEAGAPNAETATFALEVPDLPDPV